MTTPVGSLSSALSNPDKTQAMFRLDGKIALVTGAGSGIGEAIALCFAGQGANVWVVDIDKAKGAATVDAIRAAGGKADFESADVSDPAAVLALSARLPTLDILVNNAGIGQWETSVAGPAPPISTECTPSTSAACSTVAKAFVPAMAERRRGSRREPRLHRRNHRRTRLAGLHHQQSSWRRWTDKVALRWTTSHEGVRFNCICPGRVETPFVKSRLAEYPIPGEGPPRHGLDAAEWKDGQACGDRRGRPLPCGRRIRNGDRQFPPRRRGLERGQVNPRTGSPAWEVQDSAVSHVARQGRLRRDEHGPGLFGCVCDPQDRQSRTGSRTRSLTFNAAAGAPRSSS